MEHKTTWRFLYPFVSAMKAVVILETALNAVISEGTKFNLYKMQAVQGVNPELVHRYILLLYLYLMEFNFFLLSSLSVHYSSIFPIADKGMRTCVQLLSIF